jgi:hypothetical protein
VVLLLITAAAVQKAMTSVVVGDKIGGPDLLQLARIQQTRS